MAATDISLDAECIDQCIPAGFRLPVLISLFASIAKVSADPQDLIAGATCIQQCVPIGMQMPILISLAEQIVAGGGGGGSGTCLSRSVGPPVIPSTCPVAINITDAGAWYWWDNVSAAWIAFA